MFGQKSRGTHEKCGDRRSHGRVTTPNPMDGVNAVRFSSPYGLWCTHSFLEETEIIEPSAKLGIPFGNQLFKSYTLLSDSTSQQTPLCFTIRILRLPQ